MNTPYKTGHDAHAPRILRYWAVILLLLISAFVVGCETQGCLETNSGCKTTDDAKAGHHFCGGPDSGCSSQE